MDRLARIVYPPITIHFISLFIILAYSLVPETSQLHCELWLWEPFLALLHTYRTFCKFSSNQSFLYFFYSAQLHIFINCSNAGNIVTEQNKSFFFCQFPQFWNIRIQLKGLHHPLNFHFHFKPCISLIWDSRFSSLNLLNPLL